MTNPNEGAPLTRRQLRELAAQAAEQSPAPAGDAPAAQAPVAQPAVPPAATPAAPPVVPPAARPAQPMRARSVPTPITPTEGFTPVGPGATPSAPLANRRPVVPGLVPDPVSEPVRPAGPTFTTRMSTASAAPGSGGQGSAAPAMSRRSLREQTSSHQVVIVPPSQTSAIRTIDETGQLSGVLDLGSGRSAMSGRPESARPASDAAQRPLRGPAQQPSPQRISAQGLAGQAQQASQAQQAPRAQQVQQGQQAGRSPAVAGRPQPFSPQAFSPQGRGTLAGGAPVAHPVDPAQAAPLLREQAAREQAARDHAEREQAARGLGPRPAAGAASMPASWQPTPPADKPWAARDAVRTAAAVEEAPAQFRQRVTAPGFEPVAALPTPAHPAPAVEPTDALPQWAAITTPSPAPSRTAVAEVGADADDDDDFDDEDEPDHKYTWLHYLILVAVAFVLGLIIWKVGLENRGVASPADSAASVGVVYDAPSTPHDHYL